MTAAMDAIKAAAAKHGISVDEMRGKQRFAKCCAARYDAYRALDALGWTSGQIGKFFNRDHTTVLHVLGRTERGSNAEPRHRRQGMTR